MGLLVIGLVVDELVSLITNNLVINKSSKTSNEGIYHSNPEASPQHYGL